MIGLLSCRPLGNETDRGSIVPPGILDKAGFLLTKRPIRPESAGLRRGRRRRKIAERFEETRQNGATAGPVVSYNHRSDCTGVGTHLSRLFGVATVVFPVASAALRFGSRCGCSLGSEGRRRCRGVLSSRKRRCAARSALPLNRWNRACCWRRI